MSAVLALPLGHISTDSVSSRDIGASSVVGVGTLGADLRDSVLSDRASVSVASPIGQTG